MAQYMKDDTPLDLNLPTLTSSTGVALATGDGASARSRRKGSDAMSFVRAKAAEAAAKLDAEQAAVVLRAQHPLWNDEHRGVPNPFLRSSLFTAPISGPRAFMEEEKVASLSGITVVYTGKELGQDDLSVLLSLINIASTQRIGDNVFFTGYGLAKDLGWSINSASYNKIKECMGRLKATELKIQLTDGRRGYAGSLIRDYEWATRGEDPTGNRSWRVSFDPKIANLFPPDNVTYVAATQRRQIGQKAGLTLWLHGFWSSHTNPLAISVAKLHELSKSRQKEMRQFKRTLTQSLDRLVRIGFLEEYSISDRGLVAVKKAPTQRLSGRAQSKQLC